MTCHVVTDRAKTSSQDLLFIGASATMDLVLRSLDQQLLTPYVYPSSWQEDDLLRQFLSLYAIVGLGATVVYFVTSGLSFYYIFDHRLLKHPHFLENQIRKEVIMTLSAIPFTAIAAAIIFVLQARGYSKLYESTDGSEFGVSGMLFSLIPYTIFTDALNYWIHRGLHHKTVYKRLHKMHHSWKIPTPFASQSFHPFETFLVTTPYYIYPFVFPIHKYAYMGLFFFVLCWTVSVHDGDCRVPEFLQTIVNGTAHHTDHHSGLHNYNYSQFFTFWDRVGGTHHQPNARAFRQGLRPTLDKEDPAGVQQQQQQQTAEVKVNGQNGVHYQKGNGVANGVTKKAM